MESIEKRLETAIQFQNPSTPLHVRHLVHGCGQHPGYAVRFAEDSGFSSKGARHPVCNRSQEGSGGGGSWVDWIKEV